MLGPIRPAPDEGCSQRPLRRRPYPQALIFLAHHRPEGLVGRERPCPLPPGLRHAGQARPDLGQQDVRVAMARDQAAEYFLRAHPPQQDAFLRLCLRNCTGPSREQNSRATRLQHYLGAQIESPTSLSELGQ